MPLSFSRSFASRGFFFLPVSHSLLSTFPRIINSTGVSKKIWVMIRLAMRSEECRTQVLIELLPRLPEELLEKTVDRIQATWDEGCRAELLAQLAPYASEALLPRLLEIASTIEDQGYCVWLLAELEAPLAEKLNETDSDIFTVFQAIPTGEE